MSAPATPAVASPGRRALAGTVDAAPFVALFVASAAAGRRPRGAALLHWLGRSGFPVTVGLEALRLLGASPGARVAGIVTGDPLSGRRIGIARAAALLAAQHGPGIAARRATRDERMRVTAARKAVLEAWRTRRGDPLRRDRAEALARAMRDQRIWPTVVKQLLVATALRWLLRPLSARVRGGRVVLVRGIAAAP